MFAKTLTQLDANNGGGFSVSRYCAEMIFPQLDYSTDPPMQTILAKDVHGVTWKVVPFNVFFFFFFQIFLIFF